MLRFSWLALFECFFSFFWCSLPPAFGQSRVDCNALESRILGERVRYCVLLPADFDAAIRNTPAKRFPVLYFLHGLGDNEQTLFKSGGWNLIEDLRQQGRIGDFLIVAPEGGRSFYINSADGKVRYNDFFLREFLPFIEQHYPIRRQRQARAVSGVSMGGYGALRLAFAYPELFSSVSAQSAALITDSPRELNQALETGSPLGRLMGSVFGSPIDVAHWKQNSPFVLAEQNRARLAKVAIYFNCGRDDEYGFETGASALDRQLGEERIGHEYRLYPGGHSATYFMSHLGETMEFHWRVFQKDK
jgi:S-formylglutathione hydrolase FrmB